MTRTASPPPLIGALLRRPWQAARRRIHRALHEAGFTDLRPAHLGVFQHPGPEGRRPSELAREAGTTKQAMGHLIDQLVALGYLRRRALDRDPRGVTLALTKRGHAAVGAIRDVVLGIEADWARDLGRGRFEELRRLLVDLNRSLSAPERA